MSDATQSTMFNKGDLYYSRRNQLAKFNKFPEEGGEYRSITILFDQLMLIEFLLAHPRELRKALPMGAFQSLPNKSVLGHFMESLRAYENILNERDNKEVLRLKQDEALLLLLSVNPQLADILFDFNDPGKIDLESFMNRHYQIKVDLKKFAYLTGRSLSTFKRDFEKTFKDSPNHWLIKRRLQEAHFPYQRKE